MNVVKGTNGSFLDGTLLYYAPAASRGTAAVGTVVAQGDCTLSRCPSNIVTCTNRNLRLGYSS